MNRIPPTLTEDQGVTATLGKMLGDIRSRMCVSYCKYHEAMETEAADCSIQTMCAQCPMREF